MDECSTGWYGTRSGGRYHATWADRLVKDWACSANRRFICRDWIRNEKSATLPFPMMSEWPVMLVQSVASANVGQRLIRLDRSYVD